MVDGPDAGTLVILEAGLGASALYWLPVQRLLRDRYRVVAYDRAGIGGSDPSTRPRTLEALAADLDVVIDAFPHRKVVLVGHSWGGPIIRVAAARRLAAGQHDVAGLVLVDQTDENNPLFFTRRVRRQFAVAAAAMRALAGVTRVLPMARLLNTSRITPFRRAMVEATLSPSAARSAAAELRPVIDQLRWLHERPLDLGDIPIRVLSGQQTPRFGQRSRVELIAGHRKTADDHPGGQFVPAYRSEHQIPTTEPDLIADQVRQVEDQAG